MLRLIKTLLLASCVCASVISVMGCGDDSGKKSGGSGSGGASGTGASAGTSGSSGTGASAGTSAAAGTAATAGTGAAAGDKWFCSQAQDACSCIKTSVSGDNCTSKPNPACCFTHVDNGIMSCQCWPASSSTCSIVGTNGYESISTCPPP